MSFRIAHLTQPRLSCVFNDFHEKLSSISDLIPQLIKDAIPSMHDNVKEVATNSLHSYCDIVDCWYPNLR